ncbi:MAG TPA: carboxypeptidase-like regulatory domain-containing protein [Kofleriaceae bacterium]|nr:carboxypeptidase-like regulatory domain-containing protein [Kofleriaceae bacterium]
MPSPGSSSLVSSAFLSAFLLAAALAACGGDDGGGPTGVTPAIIPGGGVHDPGLDGALNVFVIDHDDGSPLAGAEVRVGATTVTTDATGLAIVDGLTGPQTIAARADGHAPAVWVGADGANVTIPLERTPPDTSRPPSAQLTGSITGWDGLPMPDLNHRQIALIHYAQDPDLAARANTIQQPTAMGSLPAASCLRVRGPSTPCAWKLNARAGAIALGLTLLDVDDRGTPDPGDDATVISGFSVHPITVTAGMNQSGVMLDLPPADSTVRPTVDTGTPPAALTQVGVQIGLDLGAAGVLRFPEVDPTRAGAVIPQLTIAPGATYELLGLAREPVADGTAADSVTLHRGLTDPTTLSAGPWLEPPTALASDRTMVSFTRVRADGPYAVELTDAGLGVEGRPVLSVLILDASSQVALPTDFAPLPADPLTMKVTTVDAGTIDLRNFEIDTVVAHLAGTASDTIALPVTSP